MRREVLEVIDDGLGAVVEVSKNKDRTGAAVGFIDVTMTHEPSGIHVGGRVYIDRAAAKKLRAAIAEMLVGSGK